MQGETLQYISLIEDSRCAAARLADCQRVIFWSEDKNLNINIGAVAEKILLVDYDKI